HNPTGKVYSREELSLIADLCVRHDAIALTDEVYERLTYEAGSSHVRLATLPGMAERTVTMSSLGKTFSLTGWKIGWAIASPVLSRAVRAAHQLLTLATATAFQHGAAAGLANLAEREKYVHELLEHFRWARSYLVKNLNEMGFGVIAPAGA